MKNYVNLGLFILLFSFASVDAKDRKVKNQTELKAAIETAVAGDNIILANGTWKDIQIDFTEKVQLKHRLL